MDQSRKSQTKFLRVESNKFPKKENKRKKKFTIDSSDLTKYRSNNKLLRSRSGTPQLNTKYKISNSKMKKKLKIFNEKTFLNGFSKKPIVNENYLQTPTRPIYKGNLKF